MRRRLAAAAAHFKRDLDDNVGRIATIVADARREEAELLVLPMGALGGYHDDLDGRLDPTLGPPPAVALDGPEVAAVADLARGMVVCLGLTEQRPEGLSNTAVCVSDGEVLGVHRKVHLPAGERDHYLPGDSLAAIDTPVGRLGMLIDYDKTFPETARTLALDGARVIANPCAWPASTTNATSLVRDRQRRMYDLYDAARAAENQVVLVSANQTGRHGRMQFFGRSKVVRPDGDIAAVVGARAGLAIADVDVEADVDAARRTFFHLKERRPDLYHGGGP